MTAKTKAKLTELTNTVNSLYASQTQKSQTIKYLVIGIVVLGAAILYFFFLRKRRR